MTELRLNWFLLRLRIATWLVHDMRPEMFVGRAVRHDGSVEWDCGERVESGLLRPRSWGDCVQVPDE